MRVSKDPKDAAYDPRGRKVFVSEKPVENWVSADEFRRVVVCTDRTIFGDVYIERLPEVVKEEVKNFVESEKQIEKPVELPPIAETPKEKFGDYSMGNRFRFKDSK